jgi:protease PrsW
VIAFGLLAVAYLWFIHYEDRYTTVPRKLAAAGFVWGAVAAIGAFALFGNDAVMNLYAKTFGASFAFDWGAALTAPINEELAKSRSRRPMRAGLAHRYASRSRRSTRTTSTASCP